MLADTRARDSDGCGYYRFQRDVLAHMLDRWPRTEPWRCWEQPALPHTSVQYLTEGWDMAKAQYRATGV